MVMEEVLGGGGGERCDGYQGGVWRYGKVCQLTERCDSKNRDE